MGYPEAYGGAGVEFDHYHFNIVTEELSRAGSGGVTAALMIHSIGLPPVIKDGPKRRQGSRPVPEGCGQTNFRRRAVRYLNHQHRPTLASSNCR